MSPTRTTVNVPRTTAVADVDEALRILLRTQLSALGFEGVDVSFDTPNRDWAAKLTRPTVNVFLCDVRRSGEELERNFSTTRPDAGRAVDRPPPLRLDCCYALSAWAPEVIDEHRLLSQMVAVLNSYPILGPDLLGPRLTDGSQRYPITTRIGDHRAEKRSDFWRSVGGHYKPAVDYLVTIAIESGMAIERGPDVRDVTVRTRSLEMPRRIATEMHHIGGRVLDADGAPVADVWVTLPALGRVAATGSDGRFRLGPLPEGEHECQARDSAGRAVQAQVIVPGPALDLSIG